MKRTIVLAIAIVVGIVALAGAAELKIAYVDLQRALNDCQAGKDAKEQLKKTFEGKNKDIQQKERAIKALQDEIKAKQTVLSEEALQKKQDELDRLMRDYKRAVQDLKEDLAKKEAQYRDQILKDLLGIVNRLGKEKGYTIIFERVPGVLLYIDDRYDITDEVIKIYDQQYQKEKNR